MNAKFRGRSGPFGVKRGAVRFQIKNVIGAVLFKLNYCHCVEIHYINCVESFVGFEDNIVFNF